MANIVEIVIDFYNKTYIFDAVIFYFETKNLLLLNIFLCMYYVILNSIILFLYNVGENP